MDNENINNILFTVYLVRLAVTHISHTMQNGWMINGQYIGKITKEESAGESVDEFEVVSGNLTGRTRKIGKTSAVHRLRKGTNIYPYVCNLSSEIHPLEVTQNQH